MQLSSQFRQETGIQRTPQCREQRLFTLACLNCLKRLPLSPLSCLNLAAEGPSHMGQLTQRLEWTRIGRKRCSEAFAFTAAVFLRLSPSPDVWSLCQSQLSHLSLRFTVERNGPAQFCFLLISLPMYLLPRINIFEQHCTHGDSFRDII